MSGGRRAWVLWEQREAGAGAAVEAPGLGDQEVHTDGHVGVS